MFEWCHYNRLQRSQRQQSWHHVNSAAETATKFQRDYEILNLIQIALRLYEICGTNCKRTLMSFSITTHKPCLMSRVQCSMCTQFQWPFVMNCFFRLGTESHCLTHWGQGKMAAISQTTFSNAFFSENVWFRLTFHLALTQSMCKVHWNWLVFNQLKSKMDDIKCGPTKYHTNIPLITMQTTPATTQTTNHVKVLSYNLATTGPFY